MIHKPKWLAKTTATTRGYEIDGELLKAARLSQEQIDEWNGTSAPAPVEMITEADPVVEEVEVIVEEDAPALEDMTKAELEALGREHGVELDRRKTKKSLISQMKGILS